MIHRDGVSEKEVWPPWFHVCDFHLHRSETMKLEAWSLKLSVRPFSYVLGQVLSLHSFAYSACCMCVQVCWAAASRVKKWRSVLFPRFQNSESINSLQNVFRVCQGALLTAAEKQIPHLSHPSRCPSRMGLDRNKIPITINFYYCPSKSTITITQHSLFTESYISAKIVQAKSWQFVLFVLPGSWNNSSMHQAFQMEVFLYINDCSDDIWRRTSLEYSTYLLTGMIQKTRILFTGATGIIQILTWGRLIAYRVHKRLYWWKHS